MIWELKDEKRYDMNDERYLKRYKKWYDMYIMLAGLYERIMKMEKFWDLMHLGGIPLSHQEGTDVYIQWQDNDRYALHSATVTVTSSTECLA